MALPFKKNVGTDNAVHRLGFVLLKRQIHMTDVENNHLKSIGFPTGKLQGVVGSHLRIDACGSGSGGLGGRILGDEVEKKQHCQNRYSCWRRRYPK